MRRAMLWAAVLVALVAQQPPPATAESLYLAYAHNGDFTHSEVARLNGTTVTDIVNIRPPGGLEPWSFTCCTSKGVAFWDPADGKLSIGYVDLAGGGMLARSPWSIPNPGPPQFGPLFFYDRFGNDDVFLVLRSPNFPHGTWELQKLNGTDGTLTPYFKFPNTTNLRGNTLESAKLLADTLVVLFSGPDGVSIVTVDVSYQGPRGTIVFNGTQTLNHVVLAPAPNHAGIAVYSLFFCEPSALCFVHLDPDTAGLVPLGVPLSMASTYIRSFTYDGTTNALVATFTQDVTTVPNAQMLIRVPLALAGREKTVIGPLFDTGCGAGGNCWISSTFVAP